MSSLLKCSMITLAITFAFMHPASAVNKWYYGPVTQVLTLGDDGSFIVYVDHPDIKNTCAYKRVNFTVSDMGIERTKAALSMALIAYSTGQEFGVVVDLPPAGSTCTASPTATQGAGVRD